jgi:hypothetical protein
MPPHNGQIAAAIAALLAIHATYNATLSPVARTAREPDVRAFAARVREIATPRDRLRIRAGVRGSVFFFLGHNEAALSDEELVFYDAWAPPGGRLLRVADAERRLALTARWPGRFRLLAQQDFARAEGGLVLLEDSAIGARP